MKSTRRAAISRDTTTRDDAKSRGEAASGSQVIVHLSQFINRTAARSTPRDEIRFREPGELPQRQLCDTYICLLRYRAREDGVNTSLRCSSTHLEDRSPLVLVSDHEVIRGADDTSKRQIRTIRDYTMHHVYIATYRIVVPSN